MLGFGFDVIVVITGYVARLTGAVFFRSELFDDLILDHLPAGRIYGVGDIRVEFGAAFLVAQGAVVFEPESALVAVRGPQMVFRAALRAMGGQLAAGHRDKRAVGAVNDFQISDDKAVVEGDRTKALQPVVVVFGEFNPDLSDFHGGIPYTLLI